MSSRSSHGARHYSDLSRNVFRFLPFHLTLRDLERMHGIDERIATVAFDKTGTLTRGEF